VVTLEGYGPASLGFGDAPVKANAKGEKAGLSSNRNAKTGEGRGRYLVASIESPLTESSDARLATITLKKPTAPLPEPATKTKTVSTGSAAGGTNNPTVQRVLAFLEKEAKRNPPYVWGGFSEAGYDCSGFVSKALNVGGWLNGRTDTRGLAGWGEAGPGDLVTVYVKTGTGDAHTEHTIIEVAGRFFQSGGGENDSPSGGADEFSPSPSYLAEFNVKRHPKGF
jgi:cell wall-associated NlpC family hydrolase